MFKLSGIKIKKLRNESIDVQIKFIYQIKKYIQKFEIHNWNGIGIE